jgi:DNA-directed RNA polymerase subunit K/omega
MSELEEDFNMPAWVSDTDSTIQYVDTTPLTKFETAMIIGNRALQISQNGRPRVLTSLTDPIDIARQELRASALPPMSILRYLPDGTPVRKTVNEIFQMTRSLQTRH